MGVFDLFTPERNKCKESLKKALEEAQKYKKEAKEAVKQLRENTERKKQVA